MKALLTGRGHHCSTVAVKLLSPAGRPDRIEREVHAHSRLQHANIVSLLGTWRPGHGGEQFGLVMEFMEGTTLFEHSSCK